jgi:cytochrome P450
MQGRKRIIGILKEAMAERRASPIPQNDMLTELIGNENTKYELNDEQIFDQVFVLLYSGYETVSITTMMAIKYLHDHPKALEECRVSQRIFFFFFFNSSSCMHACMFQYFCHHHSSSCMLGAHISALVELNRKNIWQYVKEKDRRSQLTGTITSLCVLPVL